jgi:hypothetical protein
MTTPATLSQPARARGVWVKDSLPDSDLTVVVGTNYPEFPFWRGFPVGVFWRRAVATTAVGLVLGWMNLEDAAKHLDSITL